MPRPVKAPRLRRPEGLTEARLEYLLHGDTIFACNPPPFENDQEALVVWEFHRDEILSGCMSAEPSRFTFLPGTRPWAFWKFDHNQAPPKRQAAALEELGLLSEKERAAVVQLAVEQMESLTKKPIDLAGRHAGLDKWLVLAWPWHLKLFDYDSHTRRASIARWQEIARQRELTSEELDEIALDPVTGYAYAAVAAGSSREAEEAT